MEGLSLQPIPAEHVDRVWPGVAHWIDRLNAKREPWWRMPDPQRACRECDAQLWLIWDGEKKHPRGCVVTQITNDGARVAEVPLVAGDGMKDWLYLLDDLEHWARGEGCVALIGWARAGWARVLKDRGWRERTRLIERRL